MLTRSSASFCVRRHTLGPFGSLSKVVRGSVSLWVVPLGSEGVTFSDLLHILPFFRDPHRVPDYCGWLAVRLTYTVLLFPFRVLGIFCFFDVS